jgi:hypothetical protein
VVLSFIWGLLPPRACWGLPGSRCTSLQHGGPGFLDMLVIHTLPGPVWFQHCGLLVCCAVVVRGCVMLCQPQSPLLSLRRLCPPQAAFHQALHHAAALPINQERQGSGYAWGTNRSSRTRGAELHAYVHCFQCGAIALQACVQLAAAATEAGLLLLHRCSLAHAVLCLHQSSRCGVSHQDCIVLVAWTWAAACERGGLCPCREVAASYWCEGR